MPQKLSLGAKPTLLLQDTIITFFESSQSEMRNFLDLIFFENLELGPTGSKLK